MKRSLALLLVLACGDRSNLPDGGDGVDAGSRDTIFVPPMVLARFVIDGDTIVLSAGGDLKAPDGAPLNDESIRLIGIDAPEIEHPPEPAECHGDAAKAFLSNEVEGKIITLSYDQANGVRDEFDRLLAYVNKGSEVINEKLISTGNARAFRQFNHRDRSKYIALEQDARNANLGLWACP